MEMFVFLNSLEILLHGFWTKKGFQLDVKKGVWAKCEAR
jgi:hypothetical protein